MQTEYAIRAGPCYNTEDGIMVRPFFIDDKLVCELNIAATMSDDLTEIKKLCRSITNKTGVELTPQELPKILQDKKIVRKDI